MFQMEMTRRAGSGRLSEIAGPATLRIDRLMRTLGLRQAALADGAASVFVASSGADNVKSAVERLGKGADGAVMNVRDEASVASVFEQIGALDHLVYTAGDWGSFRTPRPIAELNMAEADQAFTIRFWGAVMAVKHAASRIAKDGSITLTDGLIAHRPRKGAALSEVAPVVRTVWRPG
jgi:acyl-homoserine lactone acylase PvdQ